MKYTHVIALTLALFGILAWTQPVFAETICADQQPCSAEEYTYEQTNKAHTLGLEIRIQLNKIETLKSTYETKKSAVDLSTDCASVQDAAQINACKERDAAKNQLDVAEAQLNKLKSDFRHVFRDVFDDNLKQQRELERAHNEASSAYALVRAADAAERRDALDQEIAALQSTNQPVSPALLEQREQASGAYQRAMSDHYSSHEGTLDSESETYQTDLSAVSAGAADARNYAATQHTADLKDFVNAKRNEFAHDTVALAPVLSVTGQGIFADPDKSNFSIMTLLGEVLDMLIILIGTVAFIFIVIAGFRMVISAGDESALTAAKDMLRLSVIGLAVALLAYIIVAAVQGVLYAPFS